MNSTFFMLMSAFGFGCNVSHYQAKQGLKFAIKALIVIRSGENGIQIMIHHPILLKIRLAKLNEGCYAEASPLLLADKIASNDFGKGSPYSSS